MTQASPRPWYHTGGAIWYVAGEECCGDTISNCFDQPPECCGNSTPSQELIADTSEANAALIVKCVNSHDALVAALEAMTTAFKPFTSKPIGGEDSAARIEQREQIAAHMAARKLLEELKG